MSEVIPPVTGVFTELPHMAPVAVPSAAEGERKALDLAVLKRGAKDYLDFLDTTKEVFYGYLYHRTGSADLAKTILTEIYSDVLVRAMSLWWFGTLSLKLLLDAADQVLKDRDIVAADIGSIYLPSLVWLSEAERQSVATLHDALWSLPKEASRLLILSMLVGLSDERIGQVLRMSANDVASELKTAKDFLLTRWQPTSTVATKLQSLVFVPALDIRSETKLRFSVVEKYNALRFRRYQWVIIGGLFAVMSNVIVASVLAFAVVTAPSSSLRATRTQVASLDAVLLKRQIALDQAKGSVSAQFKEAQRLAAYDVSRDFTALGLASALESLKAQQDQEAEVDHLIKVMQRAQTAMAPVLNPIVKLAMNDAKAVFGWL